VAQTVSHYGLWISLALIAVIVVAQVRSQRHMMRTVSAQRGAAARASQGEVRAEGQVAGGDTPAT
jgi:heme exporter protein D